MVSNQPISTNNRLLLRLSSSSLAALLPKMTRVSLSSNQSIYQEDQDIKFVYFPENGMLSMVVGHSDGLQSEVGLIGTEGIVGASLLAGVTTSFVDCMVQMDGKALRMTAADFCKEADQNTEFRNLLLAFGEVFQAQIMQTAACNGRHDLNHRLARWLLLCHDRIDGNVLPLTQDFISMMIGVHRPSITVAAGIMQRAGLIRYGGGQITIVDRTGLEASCCDCYAAVRRRCEAILPTTLTSHSTMQRTWRPLPLDQA